LKSLLRRLLQAQPDDTLNLSVTVPVPQKAGSLPKGALLIYVPIADMLVTIAWIYSIVPSFSLGEG